MIETLNLAIISKQPIILMLHELHGFSNNQKLNNLFNSLFILTTKEISKFHINVFTGDQKIPITKASNVEAYLCHCIIVSMVVQQSGIILCICPTNERLHYILTSSLTGWAHT